MTNTIIVEESHNDVTGYDTKTLEVVKLGTVVSRVYQNENVQRHSFIPTHAVESKSKQKTEYHLGPTTTRFQFVDHTEVLQPFLESGYEIIRQSYSRGGLQLWAQLQPVKSRPFQDMITWDLDLWPGAPSQELRESVIVVSAVRPKKAISYHRGWFRAVCSNGMVSEILDLGKLRVNHNVWSQERVKTFIENTQPILSRLDDELLAGPWVGYLKGAERLANTIDKFLLPAAPLVVEDDDDDDSDEETIPVMPERLEDMIPLFIRDAISPLTRQPGWWLRDFSYQLRTMCDKKLDDRVYAMDIINCVTSPISRAPENSPVARALLATQNVVRASMTLLGGMSLS